jgi:hypothetical protein
MLSIYDQYWLMRRLLLIRLILLYQVVTIVSCLVSVEQAVIGNLSANLSRPVALTKIEKHA